MTEIVTATARLFDPISLRRSRSELESLLKHHRMKLLDSALVAHCSPSCSLAEGMPSTHVMR